MSNKAIAIIAGQGLLPRIVYDACVEQNIGCCVIGLSGEIDEKLFAEVDYSLFMPHNLSLIFNHLRKNDISNIVIAGKVSRKHLSKLVLDKIGLLALKEIIKNGFNDTNIYSVVIKIIEQNGFKIIPPESIAQNLIAQKGAMNDIAITEQAQYDVEKGTKILKSIIECDIGQGLIINAGLVLGVEAVEGTNELIRRCAGLRNEAMGGVLIKLCKPHQDKRLDLPCIGPDTIKNVAKYGYEGIVVEAKKSIILASAQTIKLANDNKIFIYGV